MKEVMRLLEKTSRLFEENGKRITYYMTYSVLFIVLAFCCFSWFIVSGKSLIWQIDGWNQHFKALVYYAQYLRRIIRTLLFEHQLVIPEWDFNIGEGGDILTALHYYVIGDPIAMLSVFVPTRVMHYFFSASCVLRLYLSGIAFSMLCFGTGLRDRYGIMAGALTYSFCMWGLMNAARHPYFLNPMIYFPLIILGIEKIIKKEKPYLFIIMVTISAVSNFYFFYMIVLLTVVYALIRFANIYIYIYNSDLKAAFREYALALVRLAGYALTGAMMAGALLLPMLMVFLHDSRLSSVSQPFHWLYNLSYYTKLPSIIISSATSYWLYLGLTAPALLAVFTLFMDKQKHLLLKILFSVCAVITLFPIGGRILNGLSYMTNRWCWAFALLCMYILSCEWENLLSASMKKWISMLICSSIFYCVCIFFEASRNAATFSAIPLLFLSLLVIEDRQALKMVGRDMRAQLLLLIAMAGLVNNAFWKYSPGGEFYAKEFKKNRNVWKDWDSNETAAVKAVADDSFVRYSGRSITKNANLVNGVSNTQYCWSISNPYVNSYREKLEMREESYYSFDGYDDRTTPNALAAVQFFTVKNGDNKGIPYGYERLNTKDEGSYTVYRNQYALPIGYCYDTVMSDTQWQEMNPVQKQESMLEAAYVGGKIDGLARYESDTEKDYIISYSAECKGKQIVQTDSGFVTTANNQKLVLTIDEAPENAEIYIGFDGLDITATPEYDLYFGGETADPLELYGKEKWDGLSDSTKYSILKEKLNWNTAVAATVTVESSAGVKKNLKYLSEDEPMSSGRHDYVVNLGYMEDGISTVTITLPKRGIYTLDSLRVYGVTMEGYVEKISNLQKNTLQDVAFEVNALRGDIEVDSSKLLCVATPYSEGWTGYIDGEEARLYCVNAHYLGLVIPEGKHSVYLHYQMPYKKAGFAVSLFGVAVFCAVILFEQKSKDKKRGIAHK